MHVRQNHIGDCAATPFRRQCAAYGRFLPSSGTAHSGTVRRTRAANVDRERFEDEVLAPLAAGKIAQYRPWDCHTGDFAASHNVEPARLTIVEGSYSMHPALRGYYDLMICLTIDSGEQCTDSKRCNPRMLQRFIDEWIPLENRYFATTENCVRPPT